VQGIRYTENTMTGLDQTATLNAPVVNCPHCGKPMQLMSEVDAAGVIKQRTYICGCPKEGVYHHTIHYGRAI